MRDPSPRQPTSPQPSREEESLSLPMAPRRGCVISDLHLLSTRSDLGRYTEQITSALAQADMCVLNGDIFDFRWTTLSSPEETAREASRILEEILALNPACEFHYVLGNHDRHPVLERELEALGARYPNLKVHPLCLRLGDNVFLHGDMPAGECEEVDRCGSVRRAIYAVANELGAQKLAYLRRPSDRLLRKIMEHLESVSPGITEGASNIYFGHTHVSFSSREYRGICFHNSGAAVKGVRMELRHFLVDPPAP